jgi:uncharacterized paraquat-inducible protein A
MWPSVVAYSANSTALVLSPWTRRAIPLANQRTAVWRNLMTSQKGPNIKKKQKCKNCEGKGLLKKGDKVVKCQRCGGTGVR